MAGYFLLLALIFAPVLAVGVATWRDLGGQQVVIQDSRAPVRTPDSADLFEDPPGRSLSPGFRSDRPVDTVDDRGSGVAGGSSSVRMSGTTLWVALNGPLLYLGVLLQQRLRRWQAENVPAADVGDVAARSAEEGDADPVVVPRLEQDTTSDEDALEDSSGESGDDSDQAGAPEHRSREGAEVALMPVNAPAPVAVAGSVAGSRSPGLGGSQLLYDRRSEKRIRFDVLAALKFGDSNTLVRTVDLSMSMLVCRVPAAPHGDALVNGTQAEVTLRLGDSVAVLPVTVAWRRRGEEVNTLGLQFVKLGDPEKALLRTAVVLGIET